MENRSGSVSINAENMFPIIKKWLYSEKDIFVREVVSNANDAIAKLRKLISVGEWSLPDESNNEWRIEVTVDKKAKTITVSDNGIGMTEEEVLKYINQVAFSGAKDFMEKYQGKADDAQIIGHFGLGFYSTFMVSDKVEIDTKSYTGTEAVHWESNSGMDYAISPSDLDERGTYITMHIADDSKEYLDGIKLKETLEKYFAYLPVNIYFTDVEEEARKAKDAEKRAKEEAKKAKEENREAVVEAPEAPKPINNPSPLWLKAPKDCTEEEYKEFYHKVFHDFNDPLFWIHLNIDYPFNLKGILYFPKLKNQYENIEGTIKVYYNQVFVADNIKEILPEFLLLLKGVIDCPDLPLNVSRSFLQNDGYVNKISTHITKKVADKLNGLYKNEKENYCKYWDDINPFVKYGCLKDEKFYDKIKESIVYKTTAGEYVTLEDYKDAKETYYTDNPVQQSQYVDMLVRNEKKVLELGGPIDNHFMSMIEYKESGKIKFVRVDAAISDGLKDSEHELSEDDSKALLDAVSEDFKKISGNDKLVVKAEAVKSSMPAIILLSEEARRMQEMMKMYGAMMAGMGQETEVTLVLNTANPTVSKLLAMKESNPEMYDLVANQVYDLANMAHKELTADEMTKFMNRSAEILEKAAGNI